MDINVSAGLPERVRSIIREQERRSEILIGWIQAAVVGFMGILYLVAPKGINTSDFRPVPWAVSLYLLFTCLRIVLAYRDRLNPFVLMVSVFLDILLLLGLIWSYHLQYRQPPSFYLKSPTFLYLFVFIALRTLRYETLYLIVAGSIAALGWIGLTVFVWLKQPQVVTHSYIAYMTSNSLLFGAEIDKVICLSIVTLILALGVRRARRLLRTSVSETQAAQDLSRFFEPSVVKRIRESTQGIKAGEGELRYATILSMDMRGFTKISSTISPNNIMKLVSKYHSLCVPIIHANHGFVDKFMGDGILATFGAFELSETYAADAIRAVDQIVEAIREWNVKRQEEGYDPISVGLGLSTGYVVLGAVGSPDKLEYTVIGEPVNLSAKLESHNKVLTAKALCTSVTYQTALLQNYRAAGEKETLSNQSVGGVLTPVDFVVLHR